MTEIDYQQILSQQADIYRQILRAFGHHVMPAGKFIFADGKQTELGEFIRMLIKNPHPQNPKIN
jgi:hypothetical protein